MTVQNQEKQKISDIDLVEYLAKKVMGWGNSVDWSCWEPLDNLNDAWMMSKKLRKMEDEMLLSLVYDEEFHHRASVSRTHSYDLVSFATDEKSPSRAICKAVYEAMLNE